MSDTEYPRVETRDVGRKRYRAVLRSDYNAHKEKRFKTYDEAAECIEKYIEKRARETWRPIV